MYGKRNGATFLEEAKSLAKNPLQVPLIQRTVYRSSRPMLLTTTSAPGVKALILAAIS